MVINRNEVLSCKLRIIYVKARLHRRFLSQQLNATFVALKLTQPAASVQKLCACQKVKILKATVFRELYVIPRR